MNFATLALAAVLAVGTASVSYAQDAVPQSGPAENGSPAWFIYQPPKSGFGFFRVRPVPAACNDDLRKFCSGMSGRDAYTCLYGNNGVIGKMCKVALTGSQYRMKTPKVVIPVCDHSPICTDNSGAGIDHLNNPDGIRQGIGGYIRVEWKSVPTNLGYKPEYPIHLQYRGGAVSIAIDHHNNLWVIQRNPEGQPQLFKYGPDHKLLLTVGENVIGHIYHAHGMNVDAHGNVWICDEYGSTIHEVSPDGKLLRVIGILGHRGDWNEKIGQRLLWQPVAITFAPDGDIYIGEGHANESPNDFDSSDPTDVSGAARVIHLDKNGKFLNQWYGDMVGPGKFYMVHDLAVDPRTGDVWVADRENYRLVVFTPNGQFIKTVQMRNLTCNVAFDSKGELWIGTGGDGQFLHITREGKVLGAIGNGPGIGNGEVTETGYIRWDSHGNLWTGDTSFARVTEWVKPS